ncbi:MAG: stage IV sporulation protein A [Defluviitaleaceae bacterium]|nr:stage IV sporulation protein A [Defluviitaleaceae bacterium]MCL2274055.1 stage IV sporulation protein A [Defluviitaleaceae bacterium]
MQYQDLYRDIAERTQGDIYIGVVGPVRTGKSTFIKRFMDLLVIPNIENEFGAQRAKDELPQSAAGKTIMTTEPKFVPNEAVEVKLDDVASFKVRMIDCVGYLVPGANGHMDSDSDTPRMVNTPWAEDKIPFAEAAEMGTKKVINDHSTIGIVLTTDGSIAEIPRGDYVEAEERVIRELKHINKPFVILLNSKNPFSPETEALRDELAERHSAPVVAVNAAQLKIEDIHGLIEKVLYEFPINEIRINYPKWIETLPLTHWLKQSFIKSVKEMVQGIHKLREVKAQVPLLEGNEFVKKAFLEGIALGEGTAHIDLSVEDGLFYRILSETTGMDIAGEHQLIATIQTLAEAKREYDKIKNALEEVHTKGYGIVHPPVEEMTLEAPVLVKHGAKFGVKIKASAPSIHLIKADIETEISPLVGSETQSNDLIAYINEEMADDPSRIWELNMFGKSMHEMVRDGLQNKLFRMPETAQMKFQETLQKIINEGSGGLICIML